MLVQYSDYSLRQSNYEVQGADDRVLITIPTTIFSGNLYQNKYIAYVDSDYKTLVLYYPKGKKYVKKEYPKAIVNILVTADENIILQVEDGLYYNDIFIEFDCTLRLIAIWNHDTFILHNGKGVFELYNGKLTKLDIECDLCAFFSMYYLHYESFNHTWDYKLLAYEITADEIVVKIVDLNSYKVIKTMHIENKYSHIFATENMLVCDNMVHEIMINGDETFGYLTHDRLAQYTKLELLTQNDTDFVRCDGKDLCVLVNSWNMHDNEDDSIAEFVNKDLLFI